MDLFISFCFVCFETQLLYTCTFHTHFLDELTRIMKLHFYLKIIDHVLKSALSDINVAILAFVISICVAQLFSVFLLSIFKKYLFIYLKARAAGRRSSLG